MPAAGPRTSTRARPITPAPASASSSALPDPGPRRALHPRRPVARTPPAPQRFRVIRAGDVSLLLGTFCHCPWVEAGKARVAPG